MKRFFKRNNNSDREKQQQSTTAKIKAIGDMKKSDDLFMDSNTILSAPKLDQLLIQIKDAVGVSESYFAKYYQPVIENITIRFQKAPASEYNHHSFDYGLLIHSLEVALFAVRYSAGKNYFPTRDEETIEKLQPVVTYCIFCAALLHDAAKILTDMRWYIKLKNKWVNWSCLYSAIPAESDNVPYRIRRNTCHNSNSYNKNSHELMATSLLQDCVPEVGLQWIYSSSATITPSLAIHFIHAIASDYKNADILGESIQFADKTSVERDLKQNSVRSIRANSASSINSSTPKHDACMMILNNLISTLPNDKLLINKKYLGKRSHMERVGNLLFLSGKFFAERINEEFKSKNIVTMKPQNIFTVLADNNQTLKSPTENTLWWTSFGDSDESAAKNKDLSYLVFDINKFENAVESIPDLHKDRIDVYIAPASQPERFRQNTHTVLDKLWHEEAFALLYPLTGSTFNEPPNTPAGTEASNLSQSRSEHLKSEPESVQGSPVSEPESVQGSPVSEPESVQGSPVSEPESVQGSPVSTPDTKPPVSPFSLNALLGIDERQEDNSQEESINGSFTGPDNTETPIVLNRDALIPSSLNVNISASKDENIQTVEIEPPLKPISNDEIGTILKNCQVRASAVDHEEWLTLPMNKKPRSRRAKDSNKQFIGKICHWIQQHIDGNTMTFNQDKSPLHYTKYGLFIASPDFFSGMGIPMAKDWKNIIKRSEFAYRVNTVTMVRMRVKSSGALLTGFLVNYHELKYKGNPLPINESLELAPHELQLTSDTIHSFV